MKIVDVRVKRFRCTTKTERDSEGHGHPGPERESTQSLTEIVTDEGVSGYSFGGSQSVMDGVVKPAIVGEAAQRVAAAAQGSAVGAGDRRGGYGAVGSGRAISGAAGV